MSIYHNNNGNGGSNVNASMISNATRFIITILVNYQKLNDTRLEQKEKQVILNELLNINVVDLIDNFNLVLDESISNNKLEATYHMILCQINNISNENLQNLSNSERVKLFNNSSCTISICKMLQRNNRDRTTSYSMSQLYYNVKDDAHITILQLLDKMHCFFMHSFDVCLKWTNGETNYIYNTHNAYAANEIDPMLQRIKENIDKKKQNISKTSARFDDNRYVTTLTNERKQQQNNASNEQKDKENTDNNPHTHNKHKTSPSLTGTASPLNDPFTFGKRWRYSKKYQTSDANDPKNGGKYNEWFVSQKYTNLKREILSNNLKKIQMLQWTHINNKAEQFMKCNKIKLLKAEKDINYGFDDGDSIANILQNQSIKLQHIICVLIYCNFSSIKNSLTDTYKPMNKYEQWKDVRSKHSEFANFARILTETIECFGDSVHDQNNQQNVFYHCVLGAYKLHSLHARFFVPTSMTKELSVVSYYCYNTINLERYADGLIIGLTATHSDLKYFNCSFLSDFSNEYEVILLGGKNTLYFNSIYDIKKMQNYQYYLSAIQMIDDCFIKHNNYNRGSNINQYLVNAFKKCIYNQTQETVLVPPQIDYYLNNWCVSRSAITVNMTNIAQAQSGYLKQLLFESQLLTKYEDNVYCILIDSVCRLFPNANTIHIIEPIVDKKGEIFSQFHQFLASQMFYACALTEIHLISATSISATGAIAPIPNGVIQAQVSQYSQSGWSIEQNSTTLKDYVIKRLPLRKTQTHHKSHSTPNVATNDDPFGSKMQQINKSYGHILSEGGNEPRDFFETDPLFEGGASSNINATNTVNAPINIKMRMKSPIKGNKDISVEFEFAHDDSAQQVANDMLKELNLPQDYLGAVLNTIYQCTNTNNNNNNHNHHQSDPNVVVSFSCASSEPQNPTMMSRSSADNVQEKAMTIEGNAQQPQPGGNIEAQPGQQMTQQMTQHQLNVIHEKQLMNEEAKSNMNDFGPTIDQKRALQQQQNMIKQKHVQMNNDALPSTHIHQQVSAPNAVVSGYAASNKVIRPQAQSTPHIFNAQQQTQPQVNQSQEGISLFDTPLVLDSFDKYSFPASSVQLLEGKQAEFHAEYKAFLKTQSQIFDLKLEHIQIANGNPGNYENEKQQLVKSMQEKIELKKKELTGKWDEFVQDQKELNELKQQISAKHLIQFKQQLHFEQQEDYQLIIKSDKINQNDKEEFRAKLSDFRDKMIEDYKAFRENHYGKYDNKLKEIQARAIEKQKLQNQQKQTQAIKQHAAMQYITPQQQQTMQHPQ